MACHAPRSTDAAPIPAAEVSAVVEAPSSPGAAPSATSAAVDPLCQRHTFCEVMSLYTMTFDEPRGADGGRIEARPRDAGADVTAHP